MRAFVKAQQMCLTSGIFSGWGRGEGRQGGGRKGWNLLEIPKIQAKRAPSQDQLRCKGEKPKHFKCSNAAINLRSESDNKAEVEKKKRCAKKYGQYTKNFIKM